MVIISGYRTSNKVMGQIEYDCARCQHSAYHTIVRSRRWFALYFIPLFPVRTTTIARCNLCGYQAQIDNKQADAWFRPAGPGASAPATINKGADLRYDLTISFEEAAFGCQKEIAVSRWELCPACKGSGAQPGAQASICQQCAGQGRLYLNRHLVVNIPAGVDSGINVRVRGQGHASLQGGYPGNLYVVLTVQPHSFFKRSGNDIIYELPVDRTQAESGAEVAVPVLGGKTITLRIPPHTQNGWVFRLKGMGVPTSHSDARGDQQVIVKVTTPPAQER